MTDSPSAPYTRPSVLIDPARAGGTEQRPNILIISLPQKLERTDQPTIVQGKIIETKGDGTVRIMTESGEIVAKPEKPLNIPNGGQVEIRLPKGEPPATAYVRPLPPDRPPKIEKPAIPEAPLQNVKLPPQIPVQYLPKMAEVILKSLPPQQIAKIITPYLKSVETVLTTVPSVPTLPPALPTAPAIPDPTTILPVVSQPVSESLPPPLAPIQIKLPTKPIILPPLAIFTLLEVDTVLVSSAKSLLSFLKKENTDGLIKTDLNILPQTIPLKNILASLIARPPEAPINIPKPEGLITQPPLLIGTHVPALQPLASTLPETLSQIIPPAPTLETPSSTPSPVLAVQTLSGPLEIIAVRPPLTEFFSHPLPEGAPRQETIALPLPDARIDRINAVVVGFTPEQNLPVLRILSSDHPPDRLYILPVPVQDIPLGTQIEFKTPINPVPTAPITSSLAAPLLSLSYFLKPEGRTTLQEIQTALIQNAPQIAQSFNAILPQASNPQQLGPAALFFLAAMRSGDLTSWMGEKTIDALKRMGKSDLLTKLGGEITSLSRLSSETISQEWRMASIPLSWNNDIQKIVIHYKKDERSADPENKKSGGSTRFLMNLNMSQIGPVQLDGLFQPTQKRLDLILRTQTPFSAPMHGEMRRIYKEALDETTYTGELTFQNKPEQWVHITPEKSAFSEKI